ncbi:hypothetical protein EJ06DRAFT_366876 [Trichodelitschia bisporula]|uniref:Uncharacterized protein n=1 Tax=Trichodelitschia bisporula TaxID=703511 RepID=A0A6G1I0W1_9PEZI|nr:hypothetical protein EJ06DRAFT_366876 [Trichodelitschia bisporula]
MRLLSAAILLLPGALALPGTNLRRLETPLNASSADVLYTPPPGVVVEPDLDMTKPPQTPGAKLTKIRHGPYKITPNSMLPMQMKNNLEKPCTDCYILAMQGGLEYEDGTVANIDSGAWLHHMTMSNAMRKDIVCDGWWARPQRFYSAGNEREVSRLNPGSLKFGLKIGYWDSFAMLVELMNQSDRNITVFVTQTYETLPTREAEAQGYKPADSIWMDITGCGISETEAREGRYELYSPIWNSTVDGTLIFSTGHLHDGGESTTLYVNRVPVCTNTQLYGRRRAYVEKSTGRTHISDTGVCKDFAKIKKGDQLVLGVVYDTNKYPLEKSMHGHGFEPLMGISRIYIG